MASEEWRPVVGFEGLYRVSSEGRVWSQRQDKAMKTYINGHGYEFVFLWKDHKYTNRQIHRMVTDAFLGPRPEGMDRRHLDDDKLNNKLSNLAYGTRKQNMEDAIRNGRLKRKTTCKRGHAKEGDNLRVLVQNGYETWICRACVRITNAAYAARRKQEVDPDGF